MARNTKIFKFTIPLLCAPLLFACSNDDKKSDKLAEAESLSILGSKDVAEVIDKKISYSDDDFYSKPKNATTIQLNGDSASYEGDGDVVIDGSTVEIRTSGVYELSGTLNDGQIIVNEENQGDVHLILNGVEISSSTSAPIFIREAGKTIISLMENTENTLTDGKNYVYETSIDDEPNAPLFSKDDLTINGSGTLVINGNYNNGIVSKDNLKITGGNFKINAVDDGIIGRDLVAIKDGTFTITAGGDGIKSTNDEDEEKALIAIENGTFTISAKNDGIQSESNLLIANGTFHITTGGGSPETISGGGNMPNHSGNGQAPSNNEDKQMPSPSGGNNQNMALPTNGDHQQTFTPNKENQSMLSPNNQNPKNKAPQSSNNVEDSISSDSFKGLKAGVEIAIGDGNFTIDSNDDAIHSNKLVTITGGKLDIATGDDAVHADTSLLIKGGTIHVTKSYEGLESGQITIQDGNIYIIARDDGINIAGGNDGSAIDFFKMNNSDKSLTILGGTIYVNAYGDGLDSNGSIVMKSGTVIVSGPTDDGNGALDYDGSFEISGGLLIAAGSSGMAMTTSDTSKQNSIIMLFPEIQKANTLVHLEDRKGNDIVTFAPEKDYESIVISSPLLKQNETYVLYSGGTRTGTVKNGLYADGEYKDGTKIMEFTLSKVSTWLDENGETEAKKSMQRSGFNRKGNQNGGNTSN